MELSQLAYFRAGRTEHFTGRRGSCISQPSCPRHRQPGGGVGRPPDRPGGKRVRLNPYGAAFLERVEQILSLTDEAVFSSGHEGGEQGPCADQVILSYHAPIPGLLLSSTAFFQAHPQVALSLSVRGRADRSGVPCWSSRSWTLASPLCPAPRAGHHIPPAVHRQAGHHRGPRTPRWPAAGSAPLGVTGG